jgi:hypothetical protein
MAFASKQNPLRVLRNHSIYNVRLAERSKNKANLFT